MKDIVKNYITQAKESFKKLESNSIVLVGNPHYQIVKNEFSAFEQVINDLLNKAAEEVKESVEFAEGEQPTEKPTDSTPSDAS